MFKHSLLFHAVTGTTGTDPGSSTDVSKIGGWSENVYADVSYLNNRGTPQPSLVALLSARAHVLSKNCSIVGVRVGEVTVGTRTVKAKGRSIVGRVLYAGSFGNTIDTPSAGIQLACNTNQGNALSYKLKGCPDDAFTHGELRVLISKPSICGYGMNWQHCNNTAFVGLSDSWESYYQAIRRFWRFGQKEVVNVHVISAESEGAVVENIRRKDIQNQTMSQEMVKHMSVYTNNEIFGIAPQKDEYTRRVVETEKYTLHNADCIDLVKEIESDSVGFTIYSPPFSSLFTYSNSDRDMGNNKTYDDFSQHFAFLIDEMYRITMPGRLMAVHCMQLTTSKANDGFIGIKDFRGDLIRMFQAAGWIYHSEVCIWKDPVVAMQRTKALGLLHKTIKKDSSMSRQGLADYLIVMRKPGINTVPISHTPEQFPVDMWQRYASPVWFDINQTRTLNYREARDEDDVKHICPLQLDVIERALELWSAPNDLVFSPFLGVGSEGFCSVKMGRRFIGSELKPSYFDQAVKNMQDADRYNQDLFS